ncbi:MAG: hypothetical protein JSV80_04515, partial [Acidobacteriota bacterium]
MARTPGLRTMPIKEVARQLEKARADRSDLYAPLSAVRLKLRDPLGVAEQRFGLSIENRHGTDDLALTPTALQQLCAISNMPLAFLERAPASVGLQALRTMLSVAAESNEKRFLWRLQGQRRPKKGKLCAVLPQSYVRIRDEEVFSAVAKASDGMPLRVSHVTIDDDTLSVRLLRPEKLDIGHTRDSDPAYPGIHIISSETGQHPLQVRHVLLRVVCLNGITQLADAQQTL